MAWHKAVPTAPRCKRSSRLLHGIRRDDAAGPPAQVTVVHASDNASRAKARRIATRERLEL